MKTSKADTLYIRYEDRLLEKVLSHFGGNRTKTAKHLGLSVRTIRNKIRYHKRLEKWRNKEEIERQRDWQGRNYAYFI